jgi:uncharacterized repeat protein (TIGR04076 family)
VAKTCYATGSAAALHGSYTIADAIINRAPLDSGAITGGMETEQFTLYDLRITVVAIEGRSVCGLAVGDFFEVTESNRLRIPPGKHFCLYALGAVLPLLSGYQRAAQAGDWMTQESLVACPDPEERLIMRIERLAARALRTADLT